MGNMGKIVVEKAQLVEHEKGKPNRRIVKKSEDMLQVEQQINRGVWGSERKRLLAIRSKLRKLYNRYKLNRDFDKSKNGGRPRVCEIDWGGQMTENKQLVQEEPATHVENAYVDEDRGEEAERLQT